MTITALRSDMFTVRLGVEGDRASAAEMIRARAAWMREHGHRWKSWDRDADQLADQIGKPDWPVHVLTDGEGHVVGITTPTFETPHLGWTDVEVAEPAVFLQSTVTDPRFAGARLGMIIAFWALDHAAAHGKLWTRRGVLTIGQDNRGLVRYYRSQGWRVVRAIPHPRRPEITVWSLQRPAERQPDLREVLCW